MPLQEPLAAAAGEAGGHRENTVKDLGANMKHKTVAAVVIVLVGFWSAAGALLMWNAQTSVRAVGRPAPVVATSSTAADKALAEQLIAAMEAADGTPAQEVANWLRSDGSSFIPILQGKQEGDLLRIRKLCKGHLEHCLEGPRWPVPNLHISHPHRGSI